MFFSITVVSTATRLALSSSITPDFCPARMVWVNSHSTPSSPIRPRQPLPGRRMFTFAERGVSEDGSIGSLC